MAAIAYIAIARMPVGDAGVRKDFTNGMQVVIAGFIASPILAGASKQAVAGQADLPHERLSAHNQ